MTRDEMIALAKEAGWEYATDDRGFEPLWRFAALVAEAEREACAEVCINEANVCELSCFISGQDKVSCLRLTAFRLSVCADAIRARGEK